MSHPGPTPIFFAPTPLATPHLKSPPPAAGFWSKFATVPRKPPSTYDHHWRRVRREILDRDEHRCYVAGCPTRATTVDHIVPVSEAPHLRLVPENLRASCAKHNSGRVSRRLAAQARINRTAGEVRKW